MQWDTFITRVLQGPGVALNLSTSCMWNLSSASQKKPQFGLTRVISEAIAVLYGSTHRRCLFYFPSLEFLLCHFPSVEMKGQIAIWNPYIKVRNYSLFFFFFYCWCHFGENILIDQNESPRGSVEFPYLNVKERQTTIFLVWLKSSISWRPMVPPAHGPVTSPRPVNRKTKSCVHLVFDAGCLVYGCQGRTALAKGKKAPKKYVHRFLDGGKDFWADNWLKMLLLFGRSLDFCLK